MTDPYSTLGISKSADEKAIKTAYRTLAKALHPDRNKDNPQAAERFSNAARAYDILSDKTKRAAYDRGEIDGDGNPRMPFGAGGGRGGGRGGGFRGQQGGSPFDFGEAGMDMGDIFGSMFGGGQQGGGFQPRSAPPPKGANVAYRMRVPFADAASMKPQRITLQDGKTIDLKLPSGAENGQQMRLSGKGQAGPGGHGDAMVTIHIEPHAFFSRDGDDIRLDLPITLQEAVKGGKVKAPTVDGAVMLNIPPHSSSGKLLRLRGKGFCKKDGERGDQLVRLMISLPANGGAEMEALVESWPDDPHVRQELNA